MCVFVTEMPQQQPTPAKTYSTNNKVSTSSADTLPECSTNSASSGISPENHPASSADTSTSVQALLVGIDVGSTTGKIAVYDPTAEKVLFRRYARHHARQVECVKNLFIEVKQEFPNTPLRAAFCGSGGAALAQALEVPYVQEVVANALAVSAFYPTARTAIELGGQDAKMVFFEYDTTQERLNVADMRMNGSCAGGTGAFIDEIATLLKVPTEKFNDLAAKGTSVHNISGRCGVYAKTDIQPLLNQGVSREEIALSSFHAIAKQTIGGLAQGLDIVAPVVFEGGPLTFNPRLIKVFAERLDLGREDIIIPEHPETIVAVGAALSLTDLFRDTPAILDLDDAIHTLETKRIVVIDGATAMCSCEDDSSDATQSLELSLPLFENAEEREAFEQRHPLGDASSAYSVILTEDTPDQNEHSDGPSLPTKPLPVYLGIDSGSTTTKLVLLDTEGNLVDSFYAPNEGEPLKVAQNALLHLHDSYAQQGFELDVLGVGTTGYGEYMFAQAFGADSHTVETVAHAHAAQRYVPDVTFILDIGGQDMKALWIDEGIITNVVVNEACSSGCGSFLENFASTLGIETKDIAESAFRSESPAVLGSRCTVFMNSSIVTEQKNGKTPDDIMAGLCRSIIENVFTKVIRVSNLDSLGSKIVVQGGTFLNDAVLRAFEQYVGHEVVRAPYPGLMGAIGAALIAQEQLEAKEMHRNQKSTRADALSSSSQANSNTATLKASSFIGWDALRDFSYEQETNLICPFCANRCNRTRITFSNGSSWITGNRCPRGEVVGDPKDSSVRDAVRAAKQAMDSVPNLYTEREELLFQDWPHSALLPDQNITIGLPRVLFYWDTMPFWKTLLQALGFTVKLSHLSTRAIYEDGLQAVASDTVCFPAKLVHGHLRDLHKQGVDRIFMPIVTTVPSENQADTSQSMCAVVKGYPLVIKNSDNPERRWNTPFDSPLFHWFTEKDRTNQLAKYFHDTFAIPEKATQEALKQADAAQKAFQETLQKRGAEVLAQVRKEGRYAIVLAGRPYHNDTLVNHELPNFFTDMGIPVITADSVPGVNEVVLDNSLIDIVNNFHARMLSSAVIAAQSSHMEYVQIVSFGCGHDAYLSDEIIRLMKEAGPKIPLVLKVDESDIHGPLGIRTRSFVETIERRHTQSDAVDPNTSAANSKQTLKSPEAFEGSSDDIDSANLATLEQANDEQVARETGAKLSDPYPQKFDKKAVEERVVLVPNTSHAFSRIMSAVFSKQGLRTVSLPIGRERAIYLGKKYVHNDICFPAQIVIGEALEALESGEYDLDHVAVATGKYIGDCRLTHYAALLRKALDDAGYEQVPIITNDDVDFHNIHPGFKLSLISAIRIAYTLPMIDALEELLRKMRPYELVEGSANEAFERALDCLVDGLETGGVHGAKKAFVQSIEIMKQVRYDRSNPRPTVLIVGEYLLNFHPGANHDIEDYLEKNGLEVIEARMTDVIRKTYFYQNSQVKEYKVDRPFPLKATYAIDNHVFDLAHDMTDKIAKAHPLYTPPTRMPELVKASDPIIHHTFDAGEGVLIPAEILHHAEHGCRAFVILQPFGCLPNHVVGRGIAKRLKELYPDAQILPLDFDPDVSFANIENRLQMLIMNARASHSE